MRSVATTFFVLWIAGSAAAAPLAPGAEAPPFSLPGSDGRSHSLAEYAGRGVVLAWFPKAFTPG